MQTKIEKDSVKEDTKKGKNMGKQKKRCHGGRLQLRRLYIRSQMPVVLVCPYSGLRQINGRPEPQSAVNSSVKFR